jgi:outer membrane receptor protein involved in Fe transport
MESLKNTFLLFCILCTPLILSAQETFGIKGGIVDSNGVNIESGNVIILSPADSSVIKGTHFWDGAFELYGLEETDILFKVTATGYTPFFEHKLLTPGADSLIDLGTFQLKVSVQNLEGVDVVFVKPMFERQVGKLIVNVEGTILSERGSLLDLLRSAPNVIVRSNSSVSVVGKGAAIIYLDGQRINSVEMLSAISANDVSRIEVIDSPSARYDAEGNAVIEIITKKGAMDGYQGSLSVRGIQRTDSNLWYRGQFSLRKKWFSLYASAGQYAGTLHEKEKYHREIYGTPITVMDNDVDKASKHKFNTWFYLDTDYRLDSLNTVFVNYNMYIPNTEINTINTNRIFEDDTQVGTLDSETKGSQKRFVYSVSSGYYRSLDTLGSELRLTGQYSTYDLKNSSNIRQSSNFGTPVVNSFLSENFNNIDVLAGQFDYTKKFKNNNNLSLGVKNGYVTNGSGVNFQYYQNSQWVTDSSLYNEFDYTENILAGYSELAGQIKKFSYQLGVRYEWTTTKGNSLLSGQGVVDRNYHNLFPNVQMSYKLSDDLILGATYSYRIARPSYQDLDPFINFIDSLSSFRGNPQLLPAYSNSAEVSLIYMEYASIKLGYNKTKDPMFLTVEKNNGTNTFSAIVQNIDWSETYSIGLVIPYELTWWTTFNAFGYDINKYTYTDNATLLVSNEPTWYVSLYNEFRFKNLFNLELTYDYVSPGSQGIFVVRPYQSLGGSITRKFFKDQFTVRFSVFDALFQEIESAESQLEQFNVSYTSRTDTRALTLGLTWDFGKLKNQNMAGKTIDRDEKNRIKD